LIKNGVLKRLIEVDGILGVSSNPTIFQKALMSGDVYDDGLTSLVGQKLDASAAYEALILEDIQAVPR
jgi:transaldolase